MKKLTVALFLLLFIGNINAQVEESHLINLTGIVVDADSLTALPYTHIVVKNNNTGTAADYYGFFSILAHRGDTVVFSRVGYISNQFVIPDTLKDDKYSVIHLMIKEMIKLDEVTVHPWPTFEEFKKSFANFNKDENLKNAQFNVENEKLMGLAGGIPIEGSNTYKSEVKNRHTMMYQTHGYPSYSIFNPLAWQKFIKAWRDDELKNKGNINYLSK